MMTRNPQDPPLAVELVVAEVVSLVALEVVTAVALEVVMAVQEVAMVLDASICNHLRWQKDV